MSKLLRTDDIRRYLENKKDNVKNRTRRWSACSDSSDKSDTSMRSLPQYSSYRSLSSFSPNSKANKDKMSQSSTPQSRLKQPSKLARPLSAIRPRSTITPRNGITKEDASISSTDGIGRSASALPGIAAPSPSVSRENSFTKSQLPQPVMKRELSIPQMKRESSIPKIKRELSTPQMKRESSTPQIKRESSETKSSSISATPLTSKISSRPRPASSTPPVSTGPTPRGDSSQGQIKRRIIDQPRKAGSATPSSGTPRSSLPPVSGKVIGNLKIGDRISISGSGSIKKGVIQFIGETRFAKGDWAGIVLDEAAGKNDGMVGGVRYFQCQSNYGVFVKVEKLVKISDNTDKNTPGPTQQQSPLSVSTPAKNSSTIVVPNDLKVGDKVSIGENRVGILRYLGETGFAKGVWCGVELGEPGGKNDGAVAGTRYFQCEPKFGLFAPVHKIQKIASVTDEKQKASPSVESSQEAALIVPVVVSNEESKVESKEDEKQETLLETTPSEKRIDQPQQNITNKHDSTLTPQIASLQVQLQDRENEIQQILNAREIDRQEISRAIEQYQRAENQLTSLRISHDKLLRETQESALRFQSSIESLEKVRENVDSDLEEEKRKNEDLQFQLEEQLLSKETSEQELEVVFGLKDQLKSKDKEIIKLLEDIQNLKGNEEDLKNDISGLEFQVEEALQNEIETNQNIDELRNKLESLETCLIEAQKDTDSQKESNNEILSQRDEEIKTLQEEIKISKTQCSDLEFQIRKYRDELNETIEAKGGLNKTIFELNLSLQAKDSEISSLSLMVETIKSENTETKMKIRTAESKVENVIAEKTRLEGEISNLTKTSGDNSSQLTYLNEKLSQKSKELAALIDEKSNLAIEKETLEHALQEHKDASAKEKEKIEKMHKEENDKLVKSISDLRDELNNTIEVKGGLNKTISELNSLLQAKENDISSLSSSAETFKLENTETKTKIRTAESKIENLTAEKARLEGEISNLTKTSGDSSSQLTNLNEQLSQKNRELATLIDEKSNIAIEKETLEHTLQEHKDASAKEKENIEKVHKEEKDKLVENISGLRDDLNDITEAKSNLNKTISELNSSQQAKDTEISSLNSIVETFKSENTEIKMKIRSAESKIENLTAEKARLEGDISNITKTSEDSSSQMTHLNEQLSQKNRELAALIDEKSNLAIEKETLEQALQEHKDTSVNEKQKNEKTHKDKHDKLEEKISGLEEAHKQAKIRQTEINALYEQEKQKSQKSSDELSSLQSALVEKDAQIKQLQDNIQHLTSENNDISKKEQCIQVEVQHLQQELSAKSIELENTVIERTKLQQEITSVSSSQSTVHSELNELKTRHKVLEDKHQSVLNDKDNVIKEKNDISKGHADSLNIINNVNEEKQILQQQKLQLEEKCQMLSGKCENISLELSNSVKDAERYKGEITKMQQDLCQGSDITSQLQHDLSVVRTELNSCQEKLKTSGQDKELLQDQYSSISLAKNKTEEETKRLTMLVENLKGEVASFNDQLQQSVQREITVRQSLENDRLTMQNKVESSLSQLQQNEGELSNWRNKVQDLERKLTKQTIENQTMNGGRKDTPESDLEFDSDVKQLREEVENKTNEVNFLNSVIVELQLKNKDAERKIELLESGEPLYTSDDLSLDDTLSPYNPNLKSRMFCDICDMFDLHETEDCPTQSSTNNDIGTQYHGSRGGEQRSYCTICEVFGHSTESCDDEETF